MKRINEGYEIVVSIPVGDGHELVIGHASNPRRPAQYVCWDCSNGSNYSNGGYTKSYRQALAILAERINRQYEYLPVEAPARDPATERAELIVPLISRKCHDDDEPSISVINAVQGLAEDLYCDTKFDHDLLIQWFDEHGWTEKDRNYFGISQMFDESEEE